MSFRYRKNNWRQRLEENQKRRHVVRSDNRHNPRIDEYMYERINESRDSEGDTKIKHVDKKETIKNPKKEKQNKFRKTIVSDAGHQTGVNNTTEKPKLRMNRPLHETVLNKTKIGPEDKTHLPGIRSNHCRRGRLVTKQNTSHNKCYDILSGRFELNLS